jgi:subfamily B ATP-binding cassette protein MsbA
MTYYIPNLTYKTSILKSNEKFLKDIFSNYTYTCDDSEFSLENFENNITFKGVSFKYGNNIIFKNLDLLIPENKIITIYGGIGTGKSTFVKLIFKILKPDEGEILIGNKNIADWEPKKFRKYISYIDQNSSTLFNRTILENILYGKEEGEYSEYSEYKENIIQKIKNIIEEFDLYSIFQDLDSNREKWSFLENSAGKLGEKLSGGQKQIIHLIRIELNDITKIVILDEPTSHLDINSRDKVLELVKNIKNSCIKKYTV